MLKCVKNFTGWQLGLTTASYLNLIVKSSN
nr:MAG TPA: hypothetical protein [Caudoviricetes sp.]